MNKRKIKIMHIVQSSGGVERYLLMLLKNINQTDFDNILVCSQDYKKECFSNLVKHFEQINMQREISIKQDLISIWEIRKVIKKYNPDVVYTHSSKAGAIGRIANIGKKNISFYNAHGWAFNMDCGPKKRKMYKYIEKILALLCTRIITISEFEKKSAIEERICSSKKIDVIFNGVDIDEYNHNKGNYNLTKAEIGIPEDSIIFGTVGRLTMQKAPDTFIKCAAQIRKKVPKAYFIFVGDGELREDVESLIKENGLMDRVIITGWVDEPMKYIKLFDQAFLLSRWEGFGLVLAEYMLAEKPIIATGVDAIPDLIINEINGLLVEPDNISEAVNASFKLLRNTQLKESLIENGKKIVRDKFDVTRVAKETEELIKQYIWEK